MIKNFLKKNGDVYVFTGEELHVYVPEDYLDKKLAFDYSSYLNVLGLLNCQLFKGGKAVGPLETINLPTMINLYPTEKDLETITLIKGSDESERYLVAKFYNGDSFTDVSIKQDSTYVETFLKILTGGKLLKTIPYDKILSVWEQNLKLNGVNLGVPYTVLEIIIREIYRDPDKPEYTFSKKLNRDPKASMLDYRRANFREVCARNSTFAGLTFEDMDQMINSGLNNSAYKKSQTESPIEKIIKM